MSSQDVTSGVAPGIQPSPRPGRRLVGLLGSLALSASILVLLATWLKIQPQELARHLRVVDGWLLSAALVLSVVFHLVLGSHKLYLVLRDMEIRITYLETVRVVLGMGPLQLLLPLKGGEVLAVVYLRYQRDVPLGRASGAFIVDRGLNFVAAGAWLLLGLALRSGAEGPLHAAGLLLGGALAAGLFIPPLQDLVLWVARRLHPALGRLATAALLPWRRLGQGRRLLLMAYSLLVVFRPVLVCQLLFAAFHQSPGVSQVLVYTAVAIFAGHLPGPLMGIGAREGAMMGLAAGSELSPVVALGVGLLLSLSVYVAPMLVGLPWTPVLLRGVLARRKP